MRRAGLNLVLMFLAAVVVLLLVVGLVWIFSIAQRQRRLDELPPEVKTYFELENKRLEREPRRGSI